MGSKVKHYLSIIRDEIVLCYACKISKKLCNRSSSNYMPHLTLSEMPLHLQFSPLPRLLQVAGPVSPLLLISVETQTPFLARRALSKTNRGPLPLFCSRLNPVFLPKAITGHGTLLDSAGAC